MERQGKDKMNKEAEKMLKDEFSKEELIKLLNGFNQNYIDLVKYLYDNHRAILREYEKTRGNIRIEFLGDKKNGRHRRFMFKLLEAGYQK